MITDEEDLVSVCCLTSNQKEAISGNHGLVLITKINLVDRYVNLRTKIENDEGFF